jgi:hypothetical protein
MAKGNPSFSNICRGSEAFSSPAMTSSEKASEQSFFFLKLARAREF